MGGEGGGALCGAAGKGRRGQLKIRPAEQRWQNLRSTRGAHSQGGRRARTAAARERGDAWSPGVRPPAPSSLGKTAKPAHSPTATAIPLAGGHPGACDSHSF